MSFGPLSPEELIQLSQQYVPPKVLPPLSNYRIQQAQESLQAAYEVDVHALREILAFLYSSEFLFMFLMVMAYLFWKRR